VVVVGTVQKKKKQISRSSARAPSLAPGVCFVFVCCGLFVLRAKNANRKKRELEGKKLVGKGSEDDDDGKGLLLQLSAQSA
jgi:hypothetical protein